VSEFGRAALEAAKARQRGRGRRSLGLAISLSLHLGAIVVLAVTRTSGRSPPSPPAPEPLFLKLAPPRSESRPSAVTPRQVRPPPRRRPVEQPPPSVPPPASEPEELSPEPVATETAPGEEEDLTETPSVEAEAVGVPEGREGGLAGGRGDAIHELREVARPPAVIASGMMISYGWASNLISRMTGDPIPVARGAAAALPVEVPQPPAGAKPLPLDKLFATAAQQVPGWKTITLRMAQTGRPASNRPQASTFSIKESGPWPLFATVGIEAPDEGSIRLEGTEVSGRQRTHPPEGRNVGLVFQDYALFPHLSVLENVLFGLRGNRPSAQAEALRLLERVGLQHRADSFPHTLSGGEQQRVALARSLAPQPRLLLLDEPFASLDTVLRAQIREETLQLLKERGCPAIIVTHDPEEAMGTSDRMLVLRQGRLEQQATPERIYFQPETPFVARFIGRPNVFSGEVVAEGEIRCGPLFHSQNARLVGPFRVGGSAEIVVRPEALILLPAEDRGTAEVAATAESFEADLLSVQWLAGAARIRLRPRATAGADGAPLEIVGLLPAWRWHQHASVGLQRPLRFRLEASGVHAFSV
jgi:iron(III) transport system ATP-binding protein